MIAGQSALSAALVEALADLVSEARLVRRCLAPDGCDVCKAEKSLADARSALKCEDQMCPCNYVNAPCPKLAAKKDPGELRKILWRLRRPGQSVDYDEMEACVVRAAVETEARSIAAAEAHDEGPDIWQDSSTSCDAVAFASFGPSEMVLRSLLNG